MKDIPQTGFYFDDSVSKRTGKKRHTYYMNGVKMTGCTTVLDVLNKPRLVDWAARMAVEYIENNESAFDGNYYTIRADVLEEAKTAYAKKRDDGAKKGTDTHALIELVIKQALETDGYFKGAFPWREEVLPFVRWAQKENIKFLGSEVQLYSKELFVAGTADFIFEKDGKTYIGDLKTYKKIWDRTPFYQCAGYGIMWEEMHESPVLNPTTNEWEIGHGIKDKTISGYVIFNLPKEREHDPAQDILWSFDIEGDKRAFLACVDLYRLNNRFMKYTGAPINKEDV